ncbi:MAG: hypothetical protein KIS66_01480 [Fimbriimonadaceae bacterium]|nr:hypothetical protein [Fimbriimonadaceae bacterium]
MAALHHDDFCFTYPTWNANTVLQHVGSVTVFYENCHGATGLFHDNGYPEPGSEIDALALGPPRQSGVSAGIPPMHFAFMDSCESVADHGYPPEFFAQFGRSLLYPYLPAEALEGRALLGWAIQADVNKTADIGNVLWGALAGKATVSQARTAACLQVYPTLDPTLTMFVVGDPNTRLHGVYTGHPWLPTIEDWYTWL